MGYQEILHRQQMVFLDIVLAMPSKYPDQEIGTLVEDFKASVDAGKIAIYPTPLAFQIRSHIEENGISTIYVPDDLGTRATSQNMDKTILMVAAESLLQVNKELVGPIVPQIEAAKKRIVDIVDSAVPTEDGK